jgi:hypothetical protein
MWICGVVVSGKFVGEIGRDGHVKCCMEAYRRMCGKGNGGPCLLQAQCYCFYCKFYILNG